MQTWGVCGVSIMWGLSSGLHHLWPLARAARDTVSPRASSEQPHLCPVPEQVEKGRKGLAFGIRPTNLALNQTWLLTGT